MAILKRKPSGVPIPCPSLDDVHNAFEVLENQRIHVYQVLYFAGLTTPDGYPLEVARHGVSILVYLKRNSKLYFIVSGNEFDEHILKLAHMIINAENMKKIDSQACCPYAKRKSCVCFKAFECEIHGETHIGSHD